MYREDLIDYLEGIKDAAEFKNIINSEVQDFKSMLNKKGSSVPILYDGDVGEIKIPQSYLKRICDDYLNDKLDEYSISYIADAITISENSVFESEELRDKFECLTDFEVNSHLTKDFILSLLH